MLKRRLGIILILVLLGAIAYAIASRQRSPICSGKEQVATLQSEVERTTQWDSAYSISLPLLAAAYGHNRFSYETYGDALMQALSLEKNPPSKSAWILGRYLLASTLMQDEKNAQKIADAMQKLLAQSNAIDPFHTWALGYLSIYSQAFKQQMLDSIDILSRDPQEKDKDNVTWAIVLALQTTRNREEFRQLATQLIAFTQSSSLSQALEKIPREDFRAWAISLTLQSARTVHDRITLTSLSPTLQDAIENSPSDADKLLALLITCN